MLLHVGQRGGVVRLRMRVKSVRGSRKILEEQHVAVRFLLHIVGVLKSISINFVFKLEDVSRNREVQYCFYSVWMTVFLKAGSLSPQLLSHWLPAQQCRKSNCCPICPIVWDKEGLPTDTGSPHHEIKTIISTFKRDMGCARGGSGSTNDVSRSQRGG